MKDNKEKKFLVDGVVLGTIISIKNPIQARTRKNPKPLQVAVRLLEGRVVVYNQQDLKIVK